MHELPVTQSILEIALRHASEAGAKKIKVLHLVIGSMASVVDDSIQFYWDIISKNTMAEGASLIFERIPAQIECLTCGHIYEPEREELQCPSCKNIHLKYIRGEEFYLAAIDIEK